MQYKEIIEHIGLANGFRRLVWVLMLYNCGFEVKQINMSKVLCLLCMFYIKERSGKTLQSLTRFITVCDISANFVVYKLYFRVAVCI